MIQIRNLHLKFVREYYALYDINFSVAPTESVALVGQENSGKTTLLRVIAGLENFCNGEVYVKGISIKKINFASDVSMGYIPESPVFLGKKTVYENFKALLKSRKVNEKQIEDQINKALIDFNIERLKDVKAKDLSLFDGYLVSFIRLSFRTLDIALVDNIFEKLNEKQIEIIINLITKMFLEKKVTTIVATSSEQIAKRVAGKVAYFVNGTLEKVESNDKKVVKNVKPKI
ncbi:MAG: ATP-binding cassette domain-containing protein [Clostridia bacterium]